MPNGFQEEIQYESLQLEPKVDVVDSPSLILLLFSILLIVTVKFRNAQSLRLVGRLFISTHNYQFITKELWPLKHSNTWLLNLNYLINISLVLYLWRMDENSSQNWPLFFESLLFSVVLFLIPFASMYLIRLLTGAKKSLRMSVEVTWTVPQFVGLVLLLINLAFLLNAQFEPYFLYFVGAILAMMLVIRYFRCARNVILNRIEWYYILLYLCTLEIIPLLITVWFFFML